MYCSPIDLIAYSNRARLIAQSASSDFDVVVEAQAVIDYFFNGTFEPENEQALRLLASRVEQAISNATGDINAFLALIAAKVNVTIPPEKLKVACIDMATFRLMERTDEHDTFKLLDEQHRNFFDKIATGKYAVNADEADTASTGSAETVGSEIIFTADTLEGY